MVFIPNDMTNFRLRRSALFMPSSNERALAKAPSLNCDTVIFDLEDAVGADERENAIKNLRQGNLPVAISGLPESNSENRFLRS